ncbi:exodeoxyribonuclease VII small subunit [Phocea massiliensis]|uniref:Exodeoxyribonuclease 7 small subunit n=1 Tax=Merdimmobilis hominis TaxID=2897707 RepID=A0A938X3U8_9FIRM|nr:exodeoxyribonuclease VII small subunit [Merdimmobilis hominis]MBM6919696.1 exodeoxyribonuclease VII small subunit [Merdimmobilis hominis]
MSEKKNEMTFEQAISSLEALVKTLESGELPLEDAMRQYEQGVKLAAYCSKKLNEAKLKIEELKQPHDEAGV